MKRLGLAIVLGAGAAGAQSGTPPLQLTGRLVVVNVSVTDRHGEPIRNLKMDQFKVEEEVGLRRDFVGQRVVSVEEHAAPDAAAGWTLPVLPPGVYSNIPSAPVADALTVLLLDSQGTNVAVQQRLHEQMV